jgi:hypothetical protein
MSGSVTSPWSGAPHPANSSRGIARSLGCLAANSRSILTCLRTKSTSEILRAFETQYKVWGPWRGGTAISILTNLDSCKVKMGYAGSRPDEVNAFFSIYLILPAALGPGVHSAYNRNEYQKQKNNISWE